MSGEKTATQAASPPTPAAGTIKRARVLLIVSSALLALWIATMIAMYATTVYPQRHPASAPSNSTAR